MSFRRNGGVPGSTRLAIQKQAMLERELEYMMPGDVMVVGLHGSTPGYKRCVWWRVDGKVTFCGALENSGWFKISWWWARRVNRLVWIWWEMRKASRRKNGA